jgi:hypothetical protein
VDGAQIKELRLSVVLRIARKGFGARVNEGKAGVFGWKLTAIRLPPIVPSNSPPKCGGENDR